MKKVLLISNNPLSQTRNNGKTLYSFFVNYPEELVGQIYVEESFPDFQSNISFYRITDRENLRALWKGKTNCGSMVFPKQMNGGAQVERGKVGVRDSQFTRFMRELVWCKQSWKNKKFSEWLQNFNPDVVFLYAGDSVFAYKIAEYVQKKQQCQLGVYISDDYILPRSTFGFWGNLRRLWVKKNMKRVVNKANYFFTISKEMRNIYRNILGKDSICVMNIPRKVQREVKDTKNKKVEFLYCGGLEYGREETLIELAKKIEMYNHNQPEKRAFLSIYALETPVDNVLKQLNREGSSEYKGGLTKEQVENVIEKSDVLVHVESFDIRNIESTRLSISTKISEYLSNSKAILAIGPQGISSMNYIEPAACCVTNIDELYHAVEKLINDSKYRKELGVLAGKYYKEICKQIYASLVVDELNQE